MISTIEHFGTTLPAGFGSSSRAAGAGRLNRGFSGCGDGGISRRRVDGERNATIILWDVTVRFHTTGTGVHLDGIIVTDGATDGSLRALDFDLRLILHHGRNHGFTKIGLGYQNISLNGLRLAELVTAVNHVIIPITTKVNDGSTLEGPTSTIEVVATRQIGHLGIHADSVGQGCNSSDGQDETHLGKHFFGDFDYFLCLFQNKRVFFFQC
mmetsp:Transcript_21655/g.38065  ORF Transcript_21655/g.38065 Transcript_21655/m.38065 type:complete len:211 (+) Transcript_21655:489-1121(+)